MTTNRQAVTIPSQLAIWLAEVGTVAPVDEAAALGVGWFHLGYTTEDGTSFVPSDPNFEQRRAHQSNWPVRTVQTADAARIVADLMQLDANALIAVLGGGEVTEVSAGHYMYEPPDVGGRREFAAIVEGVDGTKRYRWVVPIALQTEGAEWGLEKAAEAQSGLRMDVQGSDVAKPWYLLTNDPAFDPTGTLAA